MERGPELELNGKTYISAKRAAEILGYASDYIGQLCRAKKIDAEMVGRSWYVDLEMLKAHHEKKRQVMIARGQALTNKKAESKQLDRYQLYWDSVHKNHHTQLLRVCRLQS